MFFNTNGKYTMKVSWDICIDISTNLIQQSNFAPVFPLATHSCVPCLVPLEIQPHNTFPILLQALWALFSWLVIFFDSLVDWSWTTQMDIPPRCKHLHGNTCAGQGKDPEHVAISPSYSFLYTKCSSHLLLSRSLQQYSLSNAKIKIDDIIL